MIQTIFVSNFKSIRKPTTLSLLVDGKYKEASNFVVANGQRISLVEAVIGANATGKTTLLNALAVIKWLIADSMSDKYPMNRLFQPHAASRDSEPIELAVGFDLDGTLFEYKVTVRENHIESESLHEATVTEVRKTRKLLFEKRLSDEGYVIKAKKEFCQNDFQRISKLNHSNTSLLAIAAFSGEELPRRIVSYWDKFKTNVEFTGRFVPFGYHAFMALRRMSQNKRIPKSFETLDRTIVGFDPEEGIFTHTGKDGTFKLDIDQESSGTQQYFVIKDLLDDVLETGGTAIIDEFDAYLHPAMLKKLVEQFLDKTINPNNAQLILSTHAHLILEPLKPYQIVLVEKDRGSTIVERLDEKKDIKVRSDDNYFLKYVRGEYGALYTDQNI